jgi:hypothetical protein
VRLVCKDVRRRGIGGPALPVLALTVLALALVVAGCASKSKPAQQAGAVTGHPIQSLAFHPYTAAGTVATKVADTGRGECWTTSIAAPGSGAFRCFMGNKILDPCFGPAKTPASARLACFATPWSDAVMLTVNGTLPDATGGEIPTRPWALQLEDGTRCVASTGTVPSVAGVDLGYHCDTGGNAALVQDGAAATAQYAAPDATTVQTVNVTTLWHV